MRINSIRAFKEIQMVRIIVQCKNCGKMAKRKDFEKFHKKSSDPRVRAQLVCPRCQSRDVRGVVEE